MKRLNERIRLVEETFILPLTKICFKLLEKNMAFPYRVPPMDHQVEALRVGYPQRAFALFHEMGCGKTFTTINIAAARRHIGSISGLLVICPTPIKLVWEDEFERMCPDITTPDVFVMSSGKNKEAEKFIRCPPEDGKLKVLVVGIEALSQGKAADIANKFVNTHDTMVVVDESSKIKNPTAARTKKVIKMGANAAFRIILTGTPITQGIEDLYSQFQFLNPAIIGLKSFFVFKNRYCQMGGFEGRQIIGYQQTDELMKRVSPFIHAVKTRDVLDLPEKAYTKLIVQPTPEQKSAIKSLKDLFEAEDNGDILITQTILERLTRYQQICGGSFPFNAEDGGYLTKPISGRNPKLEALLDHIDGLANDKKALIWCRFRPEIALVSTALRARYGEDAVVEFHGGVDYDGRKQAIAGFQTESNIRFFVVNQSTGGMGITLTAASLAYYFSNSFSFEDRLQSEARIWRKGQNEHCMYVDVSMDIIYDKMTLVAIKRKQDMATYVEEQIAHNQSIEL